MALKFDSQEITGGESVYCISDVQLRKAKKLVYSDPETAGKLNTIVEQLKTDLSRNELAALSFVLIDMLQKTPVHSD